ncbi:MAG: heavy metal sensor histidine kinase [Pseudomonadota bacterium]|nr:heavy metal sensor histidine kinase [Pseudomonadota bacterium]
MRYPRRVPDLLPAMTSISLTTRISLLFAAAAALVLLVVGLFVARSVDRHFIEIDRHELTGKLDLVRNMLAQGSQETLPRRLHDALVGHHGLMLVLAGPDGALLYASAEIDDPEALLAEPPGLALWRVNDRDMRGLRETIPSGGYVVAIAQSIEHHQQFMAEFRQLLTLAIGLAALLTAALGWAATRAGLRPLREVTALAAGLSASRLGERLPETQVPAEIEALVGEFNAMLARLEDSFRRLSEFSSDIAHELRTPLSNLMTETQVALTRTRTAEEYREVLGSSLEEYERLARMIGDMLFLAQADNRLLLPKREEIDLAEEVAHLLEFFEALAADRQIRLVADGTARVVGDRAMLRRALANLLSNAIRHTPVGGEITVRLSVSDGQATGLATGFATGFATLAVENPGATIPPDALPRLFDRFYTGDPARRASGEGAGLGLAIARSIARMHGGDIGVVSTDGRACFTLTLALK